MQRTPVILLAALVAASGCYHVTVNTGLNDSQTTVQHKWASSFLWGLVPPPVETTAVACGNAGVATVETRHSFLNELVTAVTLGIYSPLEVSYTCAAH
jgi:hypothetical protein